jgi:ATP-dependent helicase/nuclease subunit B
MGAVTNSEVDVWLRGGGLVVTASERSARALTSGFHRARRAEGLTAWPAPRIQDWQHFVRTAWAERSLDERLLLTPPQEQSIWANLAGAERRMATLLEAPRYRLAALAMEAHKLLCSHAPQFLRLSTRTSWVQDAAAFDSWLTAFDEVCRTGKLLSAARLPLELIALLENRGTDEAQRPPLLLVGFDRILPVQRILFDAWGEWHEAAASEPARQIRFFEAVDDQSELTACALWCRSQLAANPAAKLLVITQDLPKRRGEIERTFLEFAGTEIASPPRFEFSLGIPLAQVALSRGAYLVLRWLTGPLEEHELDWLLSTGQMQESTALLSRMRKLRQRGLQRTRWTFEDFAGWPPSEVLPAAWIRRMTEARRLIAEHVHHSESPLTWAELVPRLLEAVGWPGARPLSSAEFQALHSWEQTLDACASLGFDGRRITWKDFLSALNRILEETLFAPESPDAPILIAGPSESAGLTADAVWFLGANEDAWPSSGSMHPLLPVEVQRNAKMPHASSQLDWELAQAVTNRLLASAPAVEFSCARQIEGVETRPSHLVVQFAGAPQMMPAEFATPARPEPLTVPFEDSSRIPFPSGKVEGGSSVLTSQSQCPFKAFATARLGAKGWEPAESGLSASQRGTLLHAVLHSIWASPPDGILTHNQLQEISDRSAFVESHVHKVFDKALPPGARHRMPQRYLALEQERLTRVIAEWLEYEAARLPFEVVHTEAEATPTIAGLALKLRLDRIDRLNDGTLLVIDYKSGDVTPKSWDLPRPDDVQLPLYAGFGLAPGETLGGLVFAKVRTGEPLFAGRVGDAANTLLPNLGKGSALLKTPLTAELLIAWRESIEQLAQDFVSGRAEVSPRDDPKTCERCDLQSLCRIQESHTLAESEDDMSSEEEAADE